MIVTTSIEYYDEQFTRDRAFSLVKHALRQNQECGKTFVTIIAVNPRHRNAVVEVVGNKFIVRVGAEPSK